MKKTFFSANDNTTDALYYTTIESQEMFAPCYPDLVYDYEKDPKKAAKKGMPEIR